MWSKEDVDEWMDVPAHVIDEAYDDPQVVRTAPHNQVIAKLASTDLNDPANRAATWRAYQRKRPERNGSSGSDPTESWAKVAL